MDPLKTTPDFAGFVAEAISRCTRDNAYRAAMQRADNPDTAAFAWEYLARWCDISSNHERLPFALIGAAIAREKPEANGKQNLGDLFRSCCKNEEDSEREQRRFRRLLGCDSSIELCEVLRGTLKYLQGKQPGQTNYIRLLQDIFYFGDKVKLRWAASFFGQKSENEEENKNVSDKTLS